MPVSLSVLIYAVAVTVAMHLGLFFTKEINKQTKPASLHCVHFSVISYLPVLTYFLTYFLTEFLAEL